MNSYSFDWLGVAVGAGLVAIVAWCITVILLKSTKRWFLPDSRTPRKEKVKVLRRLVQKRQKNSFLYDFGAFGLRIRVLKTKNAILPRNTQKTGIFEISIVGRVAGVGRKLANL